MNQEIPNDILPHLKEIASRLWSNHASIMIGAGFSKNAIKEKSTTKPFLSWNELGDCFYKKIHGTSPTHEDKSYLNVLKLADEVQASFGRPALDQLLKSELPDKEYQPSRLHERTLQLPWTDVFTTNYDTLLERAAEKVFQRRYETVVSKEDLILSTKPRIVKLHGSFPSERPFIITEEDYRKYPREFAPFVNTVQQSLLENTLCLVGFSGNDPNFLNWIGWIRDNLGKENSPKIYLIDISPLSIGEKRLLEDRNIIPINLSGCHNGTKDHAKALSLFIEFLHEQGKIEESLSWPNKLNDIHSDNKYSIDHYKNIINQWKEIRLKYPNWIILPQSLRRKLHDNTVFSYPFMYHTQGLETPLDIEFLYEINWRFERCLDPIYGDWIVYYEKILEKYNPFPEVLDIRDAFVPSEKTNQYKWDNLAQIWMELHLSILRFYREEGLKEKWILLSNRLEKIKEYLSPELLARYSYERCLYHLFSLDIFSVRKELELWISDISLPYWEAKRATLLAELGDTIEAERILELSLRSVRSKLNLSPILNEYSSVSQEAYIMQLLRHIRYSPSLRKNDKLSEDSENYRERWNVLTQYKCDPWAELKFFQVFLQKESSDFKASEKKYLFEIGSTSTTKKFGADNNNIFLQESFSYLRYIEETGIPIRIPGITLGMDTALKALLCIADYSPSWALVFYIRVADNNAARNDDSKNIFGRKALSKMSQEKVDSLASSYLSVLENSESEIINGNIYRNHTFAISLSTTIPEILSSLSVKCSYAIKIKLLSFLKELYKSEHRGKYSNIKDLTYRLVCSFSNKELYHLIPGFLEFPILGELDQRISNEYIDPFECLNIIPLYIEENKLTIESEKIDNLLIMLLNSGKNRNSAIDRLIILFNYQLLSYDQVSEFGEKLWCITDNRTGLPPIGEEYYYSVFIKLPHPKDVNPEQLFREYIKSVTFPTQYQPQTGDETNIPFIKNIIGTTIIGIEYKWKRKDINWLIDILVKWWNAEKNYLNQNTNLLWDTVSDVSKKRFKRMIEIFSSVIYPNISLISKNKNEVIECLLNELEEYGMPDLEAKASFLELFPQKQNDLIKKIQRKLFSKSESDILDAVNAIRILPKEQFDQTSGLYTIICEMIRSRTEVGLNIFIDAVSTDFLNHHQFIDEKILEDLEIGLTNLIKETVIEPEDNDETVAKKLLCKMRAAFLIVRISIFMKQQGISIPNYIQSWKNLCLDPNEFSEYRNIWINEEDSN